MTRYLANNDEYEIRFIRWDEKLMVYRVNERNNDSIGWTRESIEEYNVEDNSQIKLIIYKKYGI